MAAPAESTEFFSRLQDTVSGFLQPVQFRPARTAEEFKAASRLVYREYVKRGYLEPHPSGMKLSAFQALPTTTTFVAVHRRKGMIGTVTLVQDSPLGLPMDSIYRDELDALRQRGCRPAEASMLSIDSRIFASDVFTLFYPKKLLLTLQLFKSMFDFLRSCTPVDELVACFNPKHDMLYEFLQLQPLGELRTHQGANGHPALARHLNVPDTERRVASHPILQFFYQRPRSPSRAFASRLQFSAELLRELFVLARPVLPALSPPQFDHVRSCYPGFNFDAILDGTRLEPSPALSAH